MVRLGLRLSTRIPNFVLSLWIHELTTIGVLCFDVFGTSFRGSTLSYLSCFFPRT